MRTSTSSTALLSLCLLLAAGCAASSKDDTATGESPLTNCNAKLSCVTSDGERIDDWIERASDGRCLLYGKTELAADGTAHYETGGVGSWSGDLSKLRVCAANGWCLTCRSKALPPVDGGTEKHCTGTPDSCDSNLPGHCEDIRGCTMRSHVRWDGSWDNECEGSADSCDEMDTQDSCLSQGCSWK